MTTVAPCSFCEFVLGGARSGKTGLALARAEESGLAPVMVATAEPLDDEMRARITAHRAERGPRWTTIEEGRDLVGVIDREAGAGRILVVDCLTLWLSNLMGSGGDVDGEIDRLVDGIRRSSGPVVLISNEVGLGIVPENVLARRFRDHQGRLNRRVAEVAARVTFVAAGLPLVLKDARAGDAG
ncbi:MAG: bifunctional adenosylcobinamide kinase/adenosylcobinamide-phosphate guanylyltransferase [Siculibacillus sp.]|nr:bifunctional adenosylcobinamide kinase/adenosylcobinamide-phosphate guanylyltransferase [Siculibacillus sp.]